MENAFGSIPEKIRRSRQEIETEIESSKNALIKSLRSESDGLLKGIERREKELLKRIEKIHETEMKRGRWKLCAAIFVLGMVLGVGSAAAWAWTKSVGYENKQTGQTEIWLKLKE
jgi:hypothetical protein